MDSILFRLCQRPVLPAVCLSILVFGFAPALAQDETSSGAVSVKTILRQDGTRVVTRTDPDANTAESLTYTGKDTLIQRVVYTLNEQKIADRGVVYDGKGRFLYNLALKMNSAGQVTEEVRSDQNGNLTGRLVYSYDEKGRLRGVNAFDASGNQVNTSSPAKKDKKQRPPRKR